ncbi:sugar ABC transporter permease [Paenibacillus sp. J5C_2022]|uniref:carbohydrate ABC transporter permease n=1 Tax=Paenibacillus sp. J5C2022 TaxID=2977129 RepID=UPI0021CFAF99|nr:sugar ABC transporter permease [Paenibacillus sp. J5C2022]MCU6712340.1 sugar ABC transporter permease [Paenibacillus sp. J5C2022]
MLRRKWTLEQRKAWYGLLFATPFMFGFLFLFLIPLLQSLRYSMSTLRLSEGGFVTDYEGLNNFAMLLLSHPTFNRTLTDAIVNMVVNVPIIIIFSLFAAVLLNQRFRGRVFARSVFFLPVILASSAIASLDANSFIAGMMTSSGASGEDSGMLQSFQLEKMLLESGMGTMFVDYLTGAVDRIYEIISSSGVQILIFLAGLQSISPSLYESARMEGATGYELFWKITFPMTSPLILTNTVYSIIDSFNGNEMITLISETAFRSFEFGVSAAMSWIYFVIISIILVLSGWFISKRVFYYD